MEARGPRLSARRGGRAQKPVSERIGRIYGAGSGQGWLQRHHHVPCAAAQWCAAYVPKLVCCVPPPSACTEGCTWRAMLGAPRVGELPCTCPCLHGMEVRQGRSTGCGIHMIGQGPQKGASGLRQPAHVMRVCVCFYVGVAVRRGGHAHAHTQEGGRRRSLVPAVQTWAFRGMAVQNAWKDGR